jgi:hypothetical protein
MTHFTKRAFGCLLAAVSSMVVTQADAAIIAEYDFTGSPGNQASNTATIVALGVTATVLNRGSGITPNAGANSINSADWSLGGLDANKYYQFGVTASPASMNLNTLLFTERRSATGIRTIDLRSSLDGFASSVALIGVPDDTANRREVVTLGPAFFGLSSVTFRLFAYNAEGSLGTWRLGVAAGEVGASLPPDVELIGSLNTPEPSSIVLALQAVAIVGVAGRRYRKLHTRRESSQSAA